MSAYSLLKKYVLIIEKVQNNLFPNLDQIQESLKDFKISKRTLKRYLKTLREEFWINIEYNKEKKGYFIDKENELKIEGFLKLIKNISTTEIIINSLKENRKTFNYISFDTAENFKGMPYFEKILDAIQNKKIIEIEYQKFNKQKIKKHIIKPYLLKEYDKRWYLIGIKEEKENHVENFKTFGLDRITNLKITEHSFSYYKDLKPKELFDNIIGLVYNQHAMEEIILSFDPSFGNYVKYSPWHHSQKILIDNQNELQISLNLVPNIEFKQQIMKFSPLVKVLKPKHLSNEIRELLKKSLKKY